MSHEMSMSQMALKCAICKFGTIYYENDAHEEWISCATCKVYIHFTCLRNGDFTALCKCTVDSALPQDLRNAFFNVSEYKRYESLPLEMFIKHDKQIPYTMSWSCIDIQYFFRELGIDSDIFVKENIDGRKLLTLTMTDLKEFGFKLGPALKLYKHIKVLRWKVINSPVNTKTSILV